MKSKRFLAALITVMFILSLIGCGSAPTSTKSADSTNQANASAAGAAASAKPASKASGKVEFMCVYNSSKAKMFEMFDKFNKDNPNLKLNVTSFATSAEINKQLMVLAAGSSLPDVVSIDGLYVQSFAAMGILEDLTSRVKADFDIKQFYPGPIAGLMMNDKYYGMPFTTNDLAVYYNKNILKEKGFDEPKGDWTWDDFANIAIKTTNPSAGVYGSVLSAINTSDGTFQFYPWFWAAGGDSFKMNSDAGKDALAFYRKLIDNKALNPDVINFTQTDASDQFAGGKAALFTGGCWHLTAFEKNIKNFEWGVVNYPLNPKTKKFATSLGGYDFCAIKGGNVDGAWEFIKFMNSKEVMAYYNPAENYIPARIDVAESLDYYTNKTNKMSVYRSSMNNAKMRGPHYFWLDIDAAYQVMLQSVITGKDPIDKALADAQAKVDKIIAKK